MKTRNLTYIEGTSQKFWKITQDGATHTVQFGRIGTAGQTQSKQFADETAAKTAFDKLVAEKLKKGYVDAAGEGQATQATASPAPARPEPKAMPAAKPEPEAPIAPITAITEAPRRLVLDANDWRWAAGRKPSEPRPRPKPKPFNFAEAAERLSKVGLDQYSYRWRWDRAHIPISMSREEAHFWLLAMTGSPAFSITNKTLPKLIELLSEEIINGDLSVDAVVQSVKKSQFNIPAELVLPVCNLFGVAALVDVLKSRPSNYNFPKHLLDGFQNYVLPYLTDAESESLRGCLRPLVTPALTSKEPPHWALYLAGSVGGMESELYHWVARWPAGMGDQIYSRYHYDSNNVFLEIVLMLNDPDLITGELRRLKLMTVTPEQARAVLAATEFRALDVIRDTILKWTFKEVVESLARTLARAEAPETAPYMLDLMLESRAPRVAREWLEAHPAHAVEGLAPVAFGERGKRAEVALDLLRGLKRRGFTNLIRSRMEALPAPIAEALRSEVLDYEEKDYTPLDEQTTPEWLKAALTSDVTKSENIARTRDLPPILVPMSEGEEPRRLNNAQVGALLVALEQSALGKPGSLLGKPHPLVTALREHADRRSADAFAWKLFEQWLADGGPAKAKWEMMAVGLLGTDVSALKLAPLIRVWPGESQHPRAVLGLECLRTIGTDTALMQINGIAQKVSFKGLKAKALECMEAIAQERGLTRAELEDRVVPDCGLDARGTRVFDFGPRRFTLILGPDMKPMIKDEANQRRPDLPKPNSKDDAAKAEAALAEWKLLKKQIAEVVKIQSARLEQAMVTGRRWTPEAFDLLLVRHPLMTNLTRLLVWGAYDAQGHLLGTFRVTEDLTFADESDETFTLPEETAAVGIVHPLPLSDSQRSAWGEILGDYELIPPFPQIGRPLYGLEPDEAEADVITRFKGIKIPPQSLVFGLEKQGWIRGAPMDAGVFAEHIKVFPGADVTAVATYEGVPVGYMEGWEDQEIETCFFLRGTKHQTGYMSHARNQNVLKLAKVDPVVLSETLRDLTLIAAKGKQP